VEFLLTAVGSLDIGDYKNHEKWMKMMGEAKPSTECKLKFNVVNLYRKRVHILTFFLFGEEDSNLMTWMMSAASDDLLARYSSLPISLDGAQLLQ
jgi:hypothetical protein